MYYAKKNELMHYGVEGMKWGVRRYQNPDGSLTEEGKRRYYVNGVDRSKGLTKEGIKAQKEWEEHFSKDYLQSYNRATDRMNDRMESINKKHKKADLDNIHSKHTQAYLKEMQNEWMNIYKDELVKDFGESIEYGYDYILQAPFMDMLMSMIDY